MFLRLNWVRKSRGSVWRMTKLECSRRELQVCSWSEAHVDSLAELLALKDLNMVEMGEACDNGVFGDVSRNRLV